MGERPTILALAGPTGVGKTEVALALAERFPLALISVDSAMVYRGMDVGTAKPGPELLQRHPHALIDIRDPAEPYSAAQFLTDADDAVRSALAAGRVPLLVGGTMLYFKAFQEGLAPMPSADAGIRARLAEEAQRGGSLALYERLHEVDPAAAMKMHPNNFARVQRALEVYELAGRPISSFWSEGVEVGTRLGASFRLFSIEPDDRAALHLKLEQRLDAMLAGGFVEEVARLRARRDLHIELPAIRSVGYRQIWEHLDGRTSAGQMRDRALAATRQLAKRQLTWLRGWSAVDRLAWTEAELLVTQIAGKIGRAGLSAC